jgi:phytoene dehydrogenase-like protein
MKYDAVIIGAGLGGLVAGTKLSKSGKKVLLIEQHSIPGGCATTFKRKDFLFEVGLHEMDGLHPRDMKTKIFRDLKVFDHVEFLRVPEFYKFVHKDYNIVIPHDPEKAKETLLANFPDEEAAIDAYFYQILNIKQIKKESEGKEENNIGDFLDSITQNEDLKLALLGNLGYFHDDPYTLSLSYYSEAQNAYYSGGGNFIKGGSQKLSDYFAEFIKSNRGEVIYNHMVTRIIVKDNVAVGIEYKKKNSDIVIEAYGDNIIANASIPQLAKEMLPMEHAKAIKSDISKREIGASLLTIYLGFNKMLKDIGNTNYSTFIYDNSIEKIEDILPNNKDNFNKRSFTFVDYGQVDNSLAPNGKSTGVVCCIDYITDWDQLSKADYKAKKEEVAQSYISRLETLIPGIKDSIEYYEVATSKTVERYTLNPQGAVYGFSQTPERVRLEPISKLENLYYASAWTKIGGGFTGAIFNGYLTAFEILRKR